MLAVRTTLETLHYDSEYYCVELSTLKMFMNGLIFHLALRHPLMDLLCAT